VTEAKKGMTDIKEGREGARQRRDGRLGGEERARKTRERRGVVGSRFFPLPTRSAVERSTGSDSHVELSRLAALDSWWEQSGESVAKVALSLVELA
jgi:hypothetical protein